MYVEVRFIVNATLKSFVIIPTGGEMGGQERGGGEMDGLILVQCKKKKEKPCIKVEGNWLRRETQRV